MHATTKAATGATLALAIFAGTFAVAPAANAATVTQAQLNQAEEHLTTAGYTYLANANYQRQLERSAGTYKTSMARVQAELKRTEAELAKVTEARKNTKSAQKKDVAARVERSLKQYIANEKQALARVQAWTKAAQKRADSAKKLTALWMGRTKEASKVYFEAHEAFTGKKVAGVQSVTFTKNYALTQSKTAKWSLDAASEWGYVTKSLTDSKVYLADEQKALTKATKAHSLAAATLKAAKGDKAVKAAEAVVSKEAKAVAQAKKSVAKERANITKYEAGVKEYRQAFLGLYAAGR